MVLIEQPPKKIYIWVELGPLCFTANTAGSTVQLVANGSPTSVALETSTDGTNWSTYTIGTNITLTNVGDKIYFRNTSTTDTGFSTSSSDYYKFVMSGSISANGDTTSLLNKNGTDTLSDYCFRSLFSECSSLTTAPLLSATNLASYCYLSMFYLCTGLTTPPELPAITLASNCYEFMFVRCTGLTTAPKLPATSVPSKCYSQMFQNCTNLTALPELPATGTLGSQCYNQMFFDCSKIKLSTTQTGEYQTAYRIPTTGTGTVYNYSLQNMFYGTGGTFTGTPTINTTYYTSNTVV